MAPQYSMEFFTLLGETHKKFSEFSISFLTIPVRNTHISPKKNKLVSLLQNMFRKCLNGQRGVGRNPPLPNNKTLKIII